MESPNLPGLHDALNLDKKYNKIKKLPTPDLKNPIEISFNIITNKFYKYSPDVQIAYLYKIYEMALEDLTEDDIISLTNLNPIFANPQLWLNLDTPKLNFNLLYYLRKFLLFLVKKETKSPNFLFEIFYMYCCLNYNPNLEYIYILLIENIISNGILNNMTTLLDYQWQNLFTAYTYKLFRRNYETINLFHDLTQKYSINDNNFDRIFNKSQVIRVSLADSVPKSKPNKRSSNPNWLQIWKDNVIDNEEKENENEANWRPEQNGNDNYYINSSTGEFSWDKKTAICLKCGKLKL
jgi:hypothetical protein